MKFKNDELEITYDDDYFSYFEGYINKKRVCELYLLESKEKFWLNSINTNKVFESKGYATKLILKALEFHDAIYISTADGTQHTTPEDTRYLTPDGSLFVDKLLEMNIIKEEWMFNPFIN